MRQIHPRASSAILPPPAPMVTAAQTGITVDLREASRTRHPSITEEERLRGQLAEVRQAVASITQQLAILIHQRDSIKARLDSIVGSPYPGTSSMAADGSIVPWGFFDDDL